MHTPSHWTYYAHKDPVCEKSSSLVFIHHFHISLYSLYMLTYTHAYSSTVQHSTHSLSLALPFSITYLFLSASLSPSLSFTYLLTLFLSPPPPLAPLLALLSLPLYLYSCLSLCSASKTSETGWRYSPRILLMVCAVFHNDNTFIPITNMGKWFEFSKCEDTPRW